MAHRPHKPKHTVALSDLVTGEGIAPVRLSGLAIDSRLVKTGDLFLAYPGTQTDGRTYIAAAIKQGAAAVLYEAQGIGEDAFAGCGVPAYPVIGLENKVGRIAANFWNNVTTHQFLAAVTGTNGKSSIAYWLTYALSQLAGEAAMFGTIGYGPLKALTPASHTTPDPIRLQTHCAQWYDQGIEHVVLEASSHALDQHRLTGMQLSCGIFTNLTHEHLDYHRSMEAYGAAKALLFSEFNLKFAVINADDAFGQTLIARHKDAYPIYATSLQQNNVAGTSAIHATDITQTDTGLTVQWETPWGRFETQLPVWGAFNVSNVAALIAVLGHLGHDLSSISTVLATLPAIPGRMQRYGGGTHPICVVDYAHTPDALQNVLDAVKPHTSGKLICVFGCGGDRDRAKRAAMMRIAETTADQVILTDDNPRQESPEAIVADILSGATSPEAITVIHAREAAIQYALSGAGVGDVILVAGKGHETTQTYGQKKLPFNDGEVIQHLLTGGHAS